MKEKAVWLWILCWLLPGILNATAPEAPARIYIDGRAALPPEAWITDKNGDCWVLADVIPLTEDNRQILRDSGLDYKIFRQGKAFYDLTLLAGLLHWRTENQAGELYFYTGDYHPLESESAPGDKPSQVLNVVKAPSPAKTDSGLSGAYRMPPYWYYNSGPYYYPYYYAAPVNRVDVRLDHPENSDYFPDPAPDWED